MNIQEKIIKILQKVTGFKDIKLDVPGDMEHGDYSTNIALTMFGNDQLSIPYDQFKNPRELAEQIKDEILKQVQNDKEIVIDRIDVAGPGFINFWLKKEILFDILVDILNNKDTFGQSDINKSKKVIVEYSSVNIAKPFTVGHLRSTIIGDAIANLLKATGWDVFRDNHVGDWGTQFGKQIYAIQTWGDLDEIEKSDNPVKILVNLYVKFHEEADKDPSLDDKARAIFKRLEDGDVEIRRIWEKCIDWSWKEFTRIYEILGVSFDKEFENGRGLGESFFENKMQVVVEELENKNLLQEGKEGAKLVFFENDKYPPAMILKKDGATLYHTRDLATDKYRLENYKPDLIINEVGAEQKLYFEQLYEMEKMLGWYSNDQRVHIYHGLIRFKEGKMSTRKGNVVWLDEIINQAIDRAKKLGSESDVLAQEVAVGALKYNDLKRDSKTEIIFDWDEILNMQGNSGPYLQYTYARTQSVLDKAKKYDSENQDKLDLSATNFQLSQEESNILRSFMHFSETISEAAKMYAPNLLCSYLYDMASKFNTFYNKHWILQKVDADTKALSYQNVTPEMQNFRLALTAATGQIIKNGLNLLGIKAPVKM